MNIDLSEALQLFATESQELLTAMENDLLALDKHSDYEDGEVFELINSIFRSAHTIKGSGGLFNLDFLVDFTHEFETFLDQLRDKKHVVNKEIVSLCLACSDHMNTLVNASLDNTVSNEINASSAELKEKLLCYTNNPGSNKDIPSSVAADLWHISIRCGKDLFVDGMDPLNIIHYLSSIGEIENITVMETRIPNFDELDPEKCCLGFEVALNSSCSKAEIEEAFEFVKESSSVKIIPPGAELEKWIAFISEMPDEQEKLGEILVKTGALTKKELSLALDQQVQQGGTKPIGEILKANKFAPDTTVDAALAKQSKAAKAGNEKFVRVEAEKLDRLISLIGELVIANAVTGIRAEKSINRELKEALAISDRFVEEVRDAALSLRMVQIGDTFNRFHRVVRDLSIELGKSIELDISGADTELDKTVVDQIAEPLTHLIRNSIDHGIESIEERKMLEKAEQGQVKLNAYHETGSIVIEIKDDGRGLDKEKIIKKAREKGIIESSENMSDHDIFGLIFEPGFSTASSVSNISGRGVGMDVVKRTIEELRGTVEIDSELYVGTTVRLRLPLTLAIIDGFLIGVGESHYVIPLDMVDECVELDMQNWRDYIDLRGEVLPYLRLSDLFDCHGTDADRQSVVVVTYAGKKAGLVVDKLVGEFQAVIKPLGSMFTSLRWVSGCTVLGSGEVGLILDIQELMGSAEMRESTASHLMH